MAAQVAMSIVHIAEACCAAIMQLWAHISIVPLTVTQDTVVPLGTLLIDMIGTICLTLATVVEAPLSLTMPSLQCILVTLFLHHSSNGGIVNEGGTDSTTITPCCSSSVAIMGTVVVTSLIMSLYGVINMATIVCSS
jgi:hypothetical protein